KAELGGAAPRGEGRPLAGAADGGGRNQRPRQAGTRSRYSCVKDARDRIRRPSTNRILLGVSTVMSNLTWGMPNPSFMTANTLAVSTKLPARTLRNIAPGSNSGA